MELDIVKDPGYAIIKMKDGENKVTLEFISTFHRMLDTIER